ASGAVLYYRLPALKKDQDVVVEISDAAGRLVRTFTSRKDTSFKAWAGGPPAAPTLPKAQGLNRFVWDLRHRTMPGVKGVYVEASYRGHKVSPGRYRILLTA